MKYIHPDIVVGEAIPDVEPRVDGVGLELARSFVRWGRLGTGLVLVLIVGLAAFDASLKVRIVMMVVMLVGYIGVMFQPKHWRLMKRRRDQWKAEGKLKAHQIQQWGLPIRVQVELMCHQFLMIIASQGIVSVNGGLGGLSSFVAMSGILIGGWLIVYGLRAREPGQICCVDCEYPLVGLTIPCECPECGRMIYDPSWTTDRARVRSGWFFGIGGVLIPLGLMSFYVGIFQPSVLYAPMPRAALMQIAPRDRSAFEQLVRRSLSEEETYELIDRLIDANAGADGWDYSTGAQGRWLRQFVGTEMLDGDRLDRILGRVIEPIEIVGPINGRVGEEMELYLVSEEIEVPNYSMLPWLYFRGFEIGAEAVFEVGRDEPIRWRHVYQEEESPSGRVRWAWTPSGPGEYVVRARVVVALLPKSARRSKIDWKTDEPVFEASPIWYRMIDLEHTILVEE